MSYYNLRLNSWSEIETEPIELKVSGEQPNLLADQGSLKKRLN